MRKSTNPMNSEEIFEIPSNFYYGAQTCLSMRNFKIGTQYDGNRMPNEVISALLFIKQAAAQVNKELGKLKPEIADAIIAAAKEIRENLSKYKENFPLVIWQTGSGTQSNMNINEVVACRANEILTGKKDEKSPVHPNDHVNYGQSSNDTFPTAMHLSTVLLTYQRLLPTLVKFTNALRKKEIEFKDIIKIGRTHTQDATPVTLGQEFSGYLAQISAACMNVSRSLIQLHGLAQGGTAVGTGLNAHPEFGDKIAKELTKITNVICLINDLESHKMARIWLKDGDFTVGTSLMGSQVFDFVKNTLGGFFSDKSKFMSLATCDPLVEFHGSLNTLAVSCMKIANDIRFLASGPRSGLGELSLPENEPGSSIMPGKVNPTQCEALTMIACQVIGNNVAVTTGGMQGHFELNVFRPMIIDNILRSITLLSDGIDSFIDNCLEGTTANESRIKELLENSLMLVTALNPVIGYDNAAKIAKNAHKKGMTLKESAKELGFLGEGKQISESEWNEILNPKKMI